MTTPSGDRIEADPVRVSKPALAGLADIIHEGMDGP
jgi:hypothetical protein